MQDIFKSGQKGLPDTCMATGCTSPVKWKIGLTVRLLDDRGRMHEAPLETMAYVCGECGAKTKVEDFVTDDVWHTICCGFETGRRPPPNRDLTTINLLPVS